MLHWLKQMVAGRPSRRAGSSLARRARPAVEALEERLVLSTFPNLLGDQFILTNSSGQGVGQMIVATETAKTGAFTGAFIAVGTHIGVFTNITGQITRPHGTNPVRYQIQFSGDGFGALPVSTDPKNFQEFEEFNHAVFVGQGQRQGKRATLAGSLEVKDHFFEIIGNRGFSPPDTDITQFVTAHTA
jgi:hypothetical protein